MTGLLLILAALVVYALVCLVRPHQTCPRCHGERRSRNRKGRLARCRACKGKGIKARAGASLVHSFYQHVKGEPDRVKRVNRLSRSQVEAEHERKLGAIDDFLDRIAATARDDDEADKGELP